MDQLGRRARRRRLARRQSCRRRPRTAPRSSAPGASSEANAHTVRVAHIARTAPRPSSRPGGPTVHVTVNALAVVPLESDQPDRPTRPVGGRPTPWRRRAGTGTGRCARPVPARPASWSTGAPYRCGGTTSAIVVAAGAQPQPDRRRWRGPSRPPGAASPGRRGRGRWWCGGGTYRLLSTPNSGRRSRAWADAIGSAPMAGIVSYGAYLPYWRLQRAAIAEALGSGGGQRAPAASPATTRTPRRWASRRPASRCGRRPTGATPGRRRVRHDRARPTSTRPTPPPSTPRSACRPSVGAYDMVGSVRSDVAALHAAPTRAGGAGRAVATSAPGCRAAPTRPAAATARSPSCSATGPTCSPRRIGGGHAPRASSSTAGALPGDAVVAAVGGALRRARLRPAGRGGASTDGAQAAGHRRRRRRPR